MNSVNVRIDMYGENNIDDFWEAQIYELTKVEVQNLFDEYIRNTILNISWESFLKQKNVKFKRIVFDVNINL